MNSISATGVIGLLSKNRSNLAVWKTTCGISGKKPQKNKSPRTVKKLTSPFRRKNIGPPVRPPPERSKPFHLSTGSSVCPWGNHKTPHWGPSNLHSQISGGPRQVWGNRRVRIGRGRGTSGGGPSPLGVRLPKARGCAGGTTCNEGEPSKEERIKYPEGGTVPPRWGSHVDHRRGKGQSCGQKKKGGTSKKEKDPERGTCRIAGVATPLPDH